MFPSLRAGNTEELEFKWVKKKDVQLYESFTYDGLDYSLYDSVYLMEKGKPQPHIGKIIGIWENADKSKQIKVQWFLRPSDISLHLGDATVQENELFLASGHGAGLTNINPLEAIGGKCNVVCTSKDSRNAQPSPKELMMADYVFYRIFDVGKLEISDQIGDIVGELQVEHVFNRKENEKTIITQNLDRNSKYGVKNVAESEQSEKLESGKNLERLDTPGLDENCYHRIEKQFTDPKQQDLAGKASLLGETDEVSLPKELEPEGECSPGVDVHSIKEKGMSTIDKECTESANSVGCQFNDVKDLVKALNSSDEQIRIKKTGMSVRVSNELEDTPSERSKLNGIGTSSQDSSRNITQNSPLTRNDKTPNVQPKYLVICALSADAQPNAKLVKGQKLRSGVDVKLTKKSNSSNEKLSKTNVSISKRNLNFGCAGNGIENEAESNKNLEMFGKVLDVEISNPGNANNVGIQKDLGSAENSSRCRERSSVDNVFSPNEPSSSRRKKNSDEPGQATEFIEVSTSLTRKVSKKIAHSRRDPILQHNNIHEDDKILLEDLCLAEERAPKKAKYEKLKTSNDGNEGNSKKCEEAGVTKARDPQMTSLDEDVVKERSQKKAKCEDFKISRRDDKVNGEKMKEIGENKLKNLFTTSDDNGTSSPLKKAKKLNEGPSKDCSNITCKGMDQSSTKSRVPMSNKVGGKTFEVTRRPLEKKCKWLGELPWEENMKSAYGERRVVLFHNLDPRYTSGDVEDIIWHAFHEYGTARIVTASSTSNSGQAFFIFKNRNAVKDIVEKLDTRCLMLPNNRPLVVISEFDLQLPGSIRKKFVGHLSIDKVRRQEQMEKKDAICTSHYAQENTLEYDMAIEWILLYCRSDEGWKRLYEQQRKERRKLAAHIKSK